MGGLESSKLHVVHVPQPLSMPSLESAYMYDTTGTSITLKMYPSYPARVVPLVTYFIPSSSILSSCQSPFFVNKTCERAQCAMFWAYFDLA